MEETENQHSGADNGMPVEAIEEKKAAVTHSGVMIGLFLPLDLAGRLALAPEGLAEGVLPEPASELHVTLCYLGEKEQLPVSPERLVEILQNFAQDKWSDTAPITGRLNGYGRFTATGEAGIDALYLNFDAPLLPAFRQRLVDALHWQGVPINYRHGYIPHVTLAYLPAGTPEPPIPVSDEEITFHAITLAYAGQRFDIPLGQKQAGEGEPPLQAKAGARHSAADTRLLQTIHDNAVLLGADCEHGVAGGAGDGGEMKAAGYVDPETIDWANFNNALKAVGGNDDELIVANYIVLWGDENSRDLEGAGNVLKGFGTTRVNPDGSIGEWFTPETDLESEHTKAGILPQDWEHRRLADGLDPETGQPLGPVGETLGYVDWKTAVRDKVGLWVKRVLNRRNQYMQGLELLIRHGLISTSSEPDQHSVVKAADGRIVRWPLKRDTLTVTPMEWRMADQNVLQALKAIGFDVPEEAGDDSPEADTPEAAKATAATGDAVADADNSPHNPHTEKDKIMEPELLKSIVSEAVSGAVAPLQAQVDELKAFRTQVEAERPAGFGYAPPPNGAGNGNGDGGAAELKAAQVNMFYNARYQDEEPAYKAVMVDLLGKDYRQVIWEQEKAFAKALRMGKDELEPAERRLLKVQIFPPEAVKAMILSGMDFAEMKSTMVEAQGSLGGFAVPPHRQQEIAARLPGKTAVRGGGAKVVTLVNTNSTEVPLYAGGDDQYVGALRGQWGSETQTPAEDNAELQMVTVVADVYTYKVPMSQSLVEDAQNLVDFVVRDIGNTLAIDEDSAFLTGDGAGKPHGILPGGTNPSTRLTEVLGGHASLLNNGDKIIELSDSIADQYAEMCIWLFRRQTHSVIRQLKDGAGNYLLREGLADGAPRQLVGYPYKRNQSMPAIAANAYPVLFGNPEGYTIVEKPGMTIQRFQDSGTGPNKVEFHVRKRVGGRLVEPWMFAVLKIASS